MADAESPTPSLGIRPVLSKEEFRKSRLAVWPTLRLTFPMSPTATKTSQRLCQGGNNSQACDAIAILRAAQSEIATYLSKREITKMDAGILEAARERIEFPDVTRKPAA